MATPLKTLQLSTKISPKLLLSPLPKCHIDNITHKLQADTKSCTKRLDFSKDYRSPIKISNKNLKSVSNEVKICVTNYDLQIPNQEVIRKSDLLINTPNKLSLLKHGIFEDNLFEILGKGAFGTVIKAVYKNKPTAVKVIKIDKNRKLLKEYNALNLSHKNIIKITDIVVNNNNNKYEKYGLILMEYYENSKQLQTVLDDLINFDLNESTIMNFARDISDGINYCHKNNILHLDIKPKNILLCDNTCKICDFGNSMQISEAIEKYEFKGTVAYAAPEILLGKIPTKKCDVYSLGILFWQLISREMPYKDLNVECVIYKVVKFNLRPLNNNNNNNGFNEDNNLGGFKQLYCACWHEDPKYRPEASEILKILNKMC